MKTVLLLGAGISRAANPKAPLARRPPLDRDFFEISRRASKARAKVVLACLKSLVGDYTSVLSQSLETASTYLYIKAIDSSKGSIYHEGFIDLMYLLGDVLAKTTNHIRIGPRSLVYRFLLSELRKVDAPEDLTIITFNYDLLLERTLEQIALRRRSDIFTFPGCYRLDGLTTSTRIAGTPTFATENYDQRGVALLKLHGSMNWQSRHTSQTPSPRAMFSAKRGLHVVNSTEIVANLAWKRGRRKVYMKPVIIPPISGKRGMLHKDIVPIWKAAGHALAKADRVVVAGYSCPPLDLEARILLSENLRLNEEKRLYVVDPNTSISERFVALSGVDHVTVYKSLQDWVRDG